MYNDDTEYLDFLKKNNVIITSEPLSSITDDMICVNPKINWKEIVRSYTQNKVVVVDNFLTVECANNLRNFTLFYNQKEDFYKDYAAINYYPDNRNGTLFSKLCNIIKNVESNFQITDERIKFLRAWSFIYENYSQGVNAHADPAAINFNFWVTPDECLDSSRESNGLELWKLYPPDNWRWEDYNRNEKKIEDLLSSNSSEKISIKYKFNRLIIFDSKFFHKSQQVRAIKGYENRRINYTLLFS